MSGIAIDPAAFMHEAVCMHESSLHACTQAHRQHACMHAMGRIFSGLEMWFRIDINDSCIQQGKRACYQVY